MINGDAMQLYSGLPVITNKITVEEQQGVPHHLLGCIGLHEQTWVVGTFVKHALKVINEIRSRGKLPILVGGTHYYLQSLLFRDRLAEGETGQDEKTFIRDTKEQWPILQEDTATLLEELRKVDPVMADRWHPNDRRKIQRSLEIYLQTGRQASVIYAEQRQAIDGRDSDRSSAEVFHNEPGLRYPTLLFWVHADSDALNPRLEMRVDRMLESGLLHEVRTLHDFASTEAASGRPVDETRGIWVSIGYKEFKAYSQALRNDETSEKEMTSLKAEALERTKIATRQYAKRQVRWIRIKLVNALRQANASDTIYLLDGSCISAFEGKVVDAACDLTLQFLTASSPLPAPTSTSATAAEMLFPSRDYDLSTQPSKWNKRYCESCDVTCTTEEQWAMHAKSKAHRKLLAKRRKVEQEWSEAVQPPG